MAKTLIRAAVLVLALALVALCTVSPIPVAGAEGLAEVPVYTPVELKATEVAPLDYNEKAPYDPHANGYFENNMGYLDDTLSVRVEGFRAFNTDILVTWVKTADPSQLRVASAGKWPSKSTAYAHVIGKREKAVLAINGDYIVYINTGFAARNGTILRQRCKDHDAKLYDTLMVDDKGEFTIIQSLSEDKVNAYLAEHNLIHAFTFGPSLVVDGVKNENYPVKTHVATHRTQRQGIGQMPDGSYVIVTTNGPDDKGSTGLMLTEFADVFMTLGAKNAYNLDGGSSSQLVVNNTRLNASKGSQHRAIADIIYFVTACPEEAGQ